MVLSSRSLLLAPLGLALVLAGCDGATGPDRSQTRVVLRQSVSSGASFSIGAVDAAAMDREGGGHGGRGAVLALVDSLNVTITALQAQPARFVDSPDDDDDSTWETMTFEAPATVDLLALPTSEAGLEVARGDLEPGAYVRVRLLVSEANLTLRAPLTIGRHTFPANEPIPLRIPSPWVKVPGASFTVSEEEGGVIDVIFDPATSLGQLVVGGDGRLTLTPVMRGERWRSGDDDDD